jgi:hypothetical protein
VGWVGCGGWQGWVSVGFGGVVVSRLWFWVRVFFVVLFYVASNTQCRIFSEAFS